MSGQELEQKPAKGGPQTLAQLLQQGLFHHRQGDIPVAMERYSEVLSRDPKNAEALYYVAVIACQEGQFKQGVDLVRRALSFTAPEARMLNLLGQALDRLGQPLEAVKALDQAIALDPKLAAAHGNRANILVDAGVPQEALKSFNRAIELDPTSVPDLINRGALLEEMGRPAEALADYDRAIVCDPNFAGAHVNRGNALTALGLIDLGSGNADSPRFDEANAAFERAIKTNPKSHEAYLGRGLLKIMRGDWVGAHTDCEHRAEITTPTYKPLPEPRWDGGPLKDERLVLVTEDRHTDTIQFSRFAAVLAAKGFDVTLLTDKTMAPLLSTLKGVTVADSAEALRQDARPFRWLPLLSTGGLLGVTPDTVSNDVPYLAADPARAQDMAGKLGGATFKIGINWALGHSDRTQHSRRDIPLALFAALSALPGVELVSLQTGAPAADINSVPFRDKIRTVDTAGGLADSAAVMANLDLVIGCDTEIVHLAGALGRPVFTAIPLISDWRWMLLRDDTPWYPTMRLFRQDASRDWAPVLARITDAVRIKLA